MSNENHRQDENNEQEKALAKKEELSGLDKRNKEELLHSLLLADSTVYKTYLENLNDYPILDCPEELKNLELGKYTRFFKMRHFAYDKNENNRDKLVTIFHAVASCGGSIIILIVSDGEKIDYYLGTKVFANGTKAGADVIHVAEDVLQKSFEGNFPGTALDRVSSGDNLKKLQQDLFSLKEKEHNICTITGIAGLRAKEENSEKLFVQGMEKLVDSMRGEKYSLILIADPVANSEMSTIKRGYEKLYSQLAPFASTELVYGENESESVSKSLSEGLSKAVSKSVTDTLSHTKGTSYAYTKGKAWTTGFSGTAGFLRTLASTIFQSSTIGMAVSTALSIGQTIAQAIGHGSSHTSGSSRGGSVGGTFGIGPFGIGGNASQGTNESDTTTYNVTDTFGQNTDRTDGKTESHNNTTGGSDTVSNGGNINLGILRSRTTSESQAVTKNDSHGAQTSKGEVKGETKSKEKQTGETSGTGTNSSIHLKYEDKSVKKLLEKIELQLQRLDTCADLGMWNCSVYCLSENSSTSKIAASTYQSLLRGENSSIETGSITEWKEENGKKIVPYLERFCHPILLLDGKLNKEKTEITDTTAITPTSLISSSELSIHAGIPRTSVSGLPVISMASFGREKVSADFDPTHKDRIARNREIKLGHIYHMGKKQEKKVMLDTQSLKSHTFITGSTGSGKSNTIYQLLKTAKEEHVKFLVIEPAKGEYRKVFANNADVAVYGTNSKLTPLLRINPFTFPDEIHILEHLDRLIEIFNVCWPMYAAMPAILKEAIESAYRTAGWDLEDSTNKYEKYNHAMYPTFMDVVLSIRKVLNKSEYSEENRGNYKGALITRLKSLTNGINGMLFVNKEIANADLFDKNVIVDLSRVGSTETKALIMGILVMKLQEYRLSSNQMNNTLQHLTVLEEAHNLLKRTSTEQNSESSNLLGKSVEMLANSIAEMRTYGEGFIIADQSPGLLDMSVIRNTNTKIILRLPAESDRVLVGKAAGLNDDQVIELAKLPCGVAAVYQNNWVQPLLCKVDEVELVNAVEKTQIKPGRNTVVTVKKRAVQYLLSNMSKKKPLEENRDTLRNAILQSDMEAYLKVRILDYIISGNPPQTLHPISDIIAGMYHYDEDIDALTAGFHVTEEWAKIFRDKINPSITDYDWETQKNIMQCIALDIAQQNKNLYDLPKQLTEIL
ncbi:ATP-binding protein [Spirochaetia bacterium]|nr:ATP-binding protein [Spirochaetia bacterium]